MRMNCAMYLSGFGPAPRSEGTVPRYDIDRDDFIHRIERRRTWAYRRARFRKAIGTPPPLQALVYDAAFRSDAEAVAYHYAKANDHMPDFDRPVWVNEKIRWQFLNHPNPLMTIAADKIAVRDYLRLKGAVVQPPALIASGGDPAALEVAELPERFALKTAFGSGQNHLQAGDGALPRRELVSKATAWMQWDQWRHTGELHYRGVPKRWLVEELVPAAREKLEFKFFCMQGEPVFVSVITERSAGGYRRAVFDLNWNRLEIHTPGVVADPRPVPRPPDLDLMARGGQATCGGLPARARRLPEIRRPAGVLRTDLRQSRRRRAVRPGPDELRTGRADGPSASTRLPRAGIPHRRSSAILCRRLTCRRSSAAGVPA